MAHDRFKKSASVWSEALEAQGHRAVGRHLVAFIVSMCVAVLIVGSLWVSIAAISEKIRLWHAATQIIDVVDLTRHIAEIEHNLGANGREDILLRLSNSEQIKASGESNGLKALTNPWGGAVVVYTMSGDSFRLESVVSSPICSRLIGVLTKNINALGLQKIDAKGATESWRQIYVKNARSQINQNEIAAGCRSDAHVTLALTFALR